MCVFIVIECFTGIKNTAEEFLTGVNDTGNECFAVVHDTIITLQCQ